MLRDKCCAEAFSRRRANASMASTAFFFFSKRFKDINVDRCLDKHVSCVKHETEPVLRCDLDDIRSRPVDRCLVRLDVNARIDDLERRRDRTEVSLGDARGELGVGDEGISLSYKDARVNPLYPRTNANHVRVVTSSSQSIG